MAVPAVPPQRALRILIVDDEPFVCDALRMMLAFDGHAIETASNGKEALALFAVGKYDVVITDFAMPVMKGDELVAALKARDAGQPIVMITAYAEMFESGDQSMAGVDCLLSKPFLIESLREAVARAIAKARSPGRTIEKADLP